jgi:hypothetical protein
MYSTWSAGDTYSNWLTIVPVAGYDRTTCGIKCVSLLSVTSIIVGRTGTWANVSTSQ